MATSPAADRPRHIAFVDSSAIVALVDRDDAAHQAAVAAYRDLLTADYALFTTNHVVVETFDLLSTGVGPGAARRWLQEMKLAIYHVDAEDEQAARRLMTQRGPDVPQSLTDAISRTVMKRLGVADAFVVDPHVLGEG
ncbi:MAG TPA: PIN domain-containing protein [Thermomicrobiales bacterium]|nr:PIN domain-containing protein [Thermomicrobiales bacterium]